MQTSTHISPCLPAKHNTSFSCVFLKTIVDCCGYTLSLSLSTTTILNLSLIYFQAKEFEIGILFFEVLSWKTLQFCAQLTVTTSSCYYQYPCFLYNKMFSRLVLKLVQNRVSANPGLTLIDTYRLSWYSFQVVFRAIIFLNLFLNKFGSWKH